MNSNTEIAKIIFDTRKLRGMTRVELGKLVGLHETTIKKYEDSKIASISIDVLKKFAIALNLDPQHLIGWEEIASTKEEDKNLDSFMNDIINKLMKEGFIDDPNNISESVRTMIVNAVSLYVERKQRH